MTGLVLKLAPFEKLLINGAILQNGPRPARLRVRSADASILRLRDALHPREASTSAGKIYYIAQLAVAGEVGPEIAGSELLPLVEAALSAAANDLERAAFERAREAAASSRFYSVMRAVRPLLAARQARKEVG